MSSSLSRRSPVPDKDRAIIGREKMEFETSDEYSHAGAWLATDRYLANLDPGNPPKSKLVATAYLDTINRDGTPRLDLWHADGLTLRDRPQSQVGTRFYADEFILKGVNHAYTKAAREVAEHAGVRTDTASSALLVRDEIEAKHVKPRDKDHTSYKYSDLPPVIQEVLEKKMGPEVHDMVFAPIFGIFAHRRRYPFLVDPDAKEDFLLPVSHGIGANSHHARIQIGMDRWFARRIPYGTKIYTVLKMAEKDAENFPLILSGYSAEREFRLKGSGGSVTDRDAVVAYTRVGQELYDLANLLPGTGGLPAIRPVESKAKEIIAALENSRR